MNVDFWLLYRDNLVGCGETLHYQGEDLANPITHIR